MFRQTILKQKNDIIKSPTDSLLQTKLFKVCFFF